MDEKPFRSALNIIRSRLDEGPPEEHLSLNEMIHSIFNNLENLPPHKAERIRCHLERCDLCRHDIEENQKENPLFDGLLTWRAQGKSEEDFYKEIRDLLNKMEV